MEPGWRIFGGSVEVCIVEPGVHGPHSFGQAVSHTGALDVAVLQDSMGKIAVRHHGVAKIASVKDCILKNCLLGSPVAAVAGKESTTLEGSKADRGISQIAVTEHSPVKDCAVELHPGKVDVIEDAVGEVGLFTTCAISPEQVLGTGHFEVFR